MAACAKPSSKRTGKRKGERKRTAPPTRRVPAAGTVKARDPGRRQRILDVAKRHFGAHGYKRASLDAIAREAGCAKGALYLEFADKRALLQEVVLRTYHEVIARYRREVASIDSPLERIVAALRFSYLEYTREPALVRLARENPELPSLIPPELLAEANVQVDVILRWLAEARTRGELRDDLDVDAVPFVIGLLKWLPMHTDVLAALVPFPKERMLDAVIDVFRAGIARKEAP